MDSPIKKGGSIMDKNFEQATEEFISQRVNYYGQNETDAVNDAFMTLRASADRLRETLNDEQIRLLRAVEDAYRLSDGETGQFNYRAGFGDAIRFIMSWTEGLNDA